LFFTAGRQGLESALAGAAVAGFVAADGGEGLGLVGAEGAKGEGGAGVGVADLEFLVDLRLLAGHFEVEEGGFDVAEAVQAPAGGDVLVEEAEFDGGGWPKLEEVGVAEGAIFVFGFVFEDDAARGEAVSSGAGLRAIAAVGSDGAAREGAVGACRIDFALRRHKRSVEVKLFGDTPAFEVARRIARHFQQREMVHGSRETIRGTRLLYSGND
jgi:hypothetical protein